MTVDLTLKDFHEKPLDEEIENKAVLTDGMTQLEFAITSDTGAVEKYGYELGVDTDTDIEFEIINASTNNNLPTEIPRLRMPTPIILRVSTIFRIQDDSVIEDATFTFTLTDTESGSVEATQDVIFTEVLSSSTEPDERAEDLETHPDTI